MKRLILVLICVAFTVSMAVSGDLTFGNYWDYVYTMDSTVSTPDYVSSSDNWVYALYWDQSANGPDAYGSSDDIAIYTGNSWDSNYDGIFFDDAAEDAIADGNYFFLRVYNSSDWTTSSVGNATHYVNLDMFEDNDGTTYADYDATRVVDSGGSGTELWTVGSGDPVGGSNPDGSDWQAIPEPSTFMLLGLGLATILARRKLRK